MDTSLWHGRIDSGEQGDTTRLHQIVRELPDTSAAVPAGAPVVLGFACDAGVRRNRGRPGAAKGPDAIRPALAALPAHGLPVLFDAGNVGCRGDELEDAQQTLGMRVHQILRTGARLLLLGGGHEIAWGSFQGLREHLYGAGGVGGRLLIVNLDAHFDLRTSRPASSGTPFQQILQDARRRGLHVGYACLGVAKIANTPALYDQALALDVFHVEDRLMQERFLNQRLAELDVLIAESDHVYLTIDMDVLPGAVAPGVSAPAALGVPLAVIEAIALHLRASGKLRLAELAEFNPFFDQDGRTAKVAARLAWQLLQP